MISIGLASTLRVRSCPGALTFLTRGGHFAQARADPGGLVMNARLLGGRSCLPVRALADGSERREA